VTAVHVVVPDSIDDPARPSGGNVYDRRLCDGLAAAGWTVHEHAAGSTGELRAIPDDAVVLVDGLVASAAPPRPRLVVLVHMPAAGEGEREVLQSAAAVITTSDWGLRRLLELYDLPAERIHVARPGADRGELATGTASGEALLCVGAVTPVKGHDVLLDALATIADLPWRCDCVGSLDRDPAFVATLRRDDRVRFTGPLTGADLDRSYAAADLLVLASRTETYGMVLTEALARGVPVVATDVGGIGEAAGHDAALLVPSEDPRALGRALRAWLTDDTLRARLRDAARVRRAALPDWTTTTSAVARVLEDVAR
jgi:glycosyltransferase involved in cell wall biosynthesis